jgi:hypothetical protein
MRCTRKNPVRHIEKYEGPQRRSHYRIEYPITERPLLINKDKEEYEIIDVCEAGVKFFTKPGHVFLPFQTLNAKIKFHNDEFEEIEGKILRSDDNVVVVVLTKKISYKRIVKEQLYFRKKPDYP